MASPGEKDNGNGGRGPDDDAGGVDAKKPAARTPSPEMELTELTTILEQAKAAGEKENLQAVQTALREKLEELEQSLPALQSSDALKKFIPAAEKEIAETKAALEATSVALESFPKTRQERLEDYKAMSEEQRQEAFVDLQEIVDGLPQIREDLDVAKLAADLATEKVDKLTRRLEDMEKKVKERKGVLDRLKLAGGQQSEEFHENRRFIEETSQEAKQNVVKRIGNAIAIQGALKLRDGLWFKQRFAKNVEKLADKRRAAFPEVVVGSFMENDDQLKSAPTLDTLLAKDPKYMLPQDRTMLQGYFLYMSELSQDQDWGFDLESVRAMEGTDNQLAEEFAQQLTRLSELEKEDVVKYFSSQLNAIRDKYPQLFKDVEAKATDDDEGSSTEPPKDDDKPTEAAKEPPAQPKPSSGDDDGGSKPDQQPDKSVATQADAADALKDI